MIILSHRGYWKATEEKNTETAFLRSFRLGFGTETDVRDHDGSLVISHDPPTSAALSLDRFLEIYREEGAGLPLALNIKADGLQAALKGVLARFQVTNYFTFDMSLPDMLHYFVQNIPVLTRQSEYEPQPLCYEQADGVWLDCFQGDWIDEQTVSGHLDAGKRVCIVSPDLHRRPHEAFWETMAGWETRRSNRLLLCTDFPEDARARFQE
ncbi:hypothetical protein CCAX7_009300 [Capsulimonas corticalis]|uniref:Uncharacterized protein n=1 Tax=Capsulimonas corticalis TaxID=2219043 RepID=A0A402CU78_9BACT|nr:hypothetical protein [Capsulimonas corticalis]BDI28879.1 hypothetical protein CCAX7_009300 [Capsulimonas corticalis]